jgi:O-antigen ligase
VAVAVLGLAGTLLLLRPLTILVLMGATAYIEGVQLGGTTISRFVAAGALFVALADATRTRRWTMPSGPPLIWAVAYGIWAFASVLWTVNLEETWLSLAPLIVSLIFMTAIPALVKTRQTFDLVLYGIGGGAAVVGMLSVAIFVTTGGRAEGLAGDPNFFAAYQVIAFPILLVLGARATSLWLRLLLWGGVIGAVGGVFTTLSRGGILALILVAILLLLLPARTIFRSLGHKSMATFVIAVGVGLALAVSYAEVSHRVVSLVQGGEATGSGRVNEWRAAWRLSTENPALGVGYGAFRGISNDAVRRTPGTDLHNFDERPPGVYVHNAYLGSLTELGIPGLVFFVGVLFSTARALRRAAVRARWLGDVEFARTANALLLSLVGWSVASFFLSSENARPQWVVVGLALALPAVLREVAARPRRAS